MLKEIIMVYGIVFLNGFSWFEWLKELQDRYEEYLESKDSLQIKESWWRIISFRNKSTEVNMLKYMTQTRKKWMRQVESEIYDNDLQKVELWI